MNCTFDIATAVEFKSIELAILIKYFQNQFLIEKTEKYFFQKRTWISRSFLQISKDCPYWSKKQVERLMQKMIQQKILIKEKFNKEKMNQTCWYAFVDEKRFVDFEFIEWFKELHEEFKKRIN